MPKPIKVVGLIRAISSAGPERRGQVGAKQTRRRTLTLEDGSKVELEVSNARASAWSEVLDEMHRNDLPAYLEVDPSTRTVTALLCPLDVSVAKLTPLPSGDVDVELEVSQARHYLRASHPDFASMHSTLRDALSTGTPLLVTEDASGSQIIDVRPHTSPKASVRAAAPAPTRASRTPPLVTLERARELFVLAQEQTCAPSSVVAPCIPFMYPRDGCWGRAHEMRRLLLAAGTEPEKVWIYGMLRVATSNDPSCEVHWGWHVAPIVSVNVDGSAATFVIDPSMFDEPVPEQVWVRAQGDADASIVHTPGSVFYRRANGYTEADDEYIQTAAVLNRYRAQLALSVQNSGPPPYTTCYLPDIYVRDNLNDAGYEPLVGGGVSRSPDINHFRQELVDPQEVLGAPAARAREDLFEPIEYGQRNYLYVRLQNRGKKSGDADVDLYWMVPSTLPVPTSWKLVGTLHVTGIAPGAFAVAGPLTWDDIPAKGHYCFVAVLGTTGDPKPDLAAIHTVDDFQKLIRDRNNVTWKNFDVQDMFVGGFMRFEFEVRGWPRSASRSDLELNLAALPRGTQVDLHVLRRLAQEATVEGLKKVDETQTRTTYRATGSAIAALRSMALHASDCAQATLEVTLPSNARNGVYELSVLQRIDAREVGRITRSLIVGDHPYVANRQSREVHVANCEWVERMSSVNKSAYRDLALALQRGYDGCRFCLPAHNHG